MNLHLYRRRDRNGLFTFTLHSLHDPVTKGRIGTGPWVRSCGLLTLRDHSLVIRHLLAWFSVPWSGHWPLEPVTKSCQTGTLFRVSCYRRVHREHDDAHLFAQPATRRNSQLNGLDISTGSSVSSRRAAAILPNRATDFRGVFARLGPIRPRRPLLVGCVADIIVRAPAVSALRAS
jgi:hypothetical protein